MQLEIISDDYECRLIFAQADGAVGVEPSPIVVSSGQFLITYTMPVYICVYLCVFVFLVACR